GFGWRGLSAGNADLPAAGAALTGNPTGPRRLRVLTTGGTSMSIGRRRFLAGSAAGIALAPSAAAAEGQAAPQRVNRIAVSTYSFWQFRHRDLRDVGKCIDL